MAYNINYAFVPRGSIDSDLNLTVGGYDDDVNASDYILLLVAI